MEPMSTPAKSLRHGNICTLPSARILSPETTCRRRSEEHTSELQSLRHLVCRLLLEKKKKSLFMTSLNPDNRIFDQRQLTIYVHSQRVHNEDGHSLHYRLHLQFVPYLSSPLEQHIVL